MFNFIKENLKIFFIGVAIIIFIVLGVGIPLILRPFNGVDALVKNNEEREFIKSAFNETYSLLSSFYIIKVWRVKVVKLFRDVPICGRNEKYLAFIKGYTLFNIPIGYGLVDSLDSNPNHVGGAIAMSPLKYKELIDSPESAFDCPLNIEY